MKNRLILIAVLLFTFGSVAGFSYAGALVHWLTVPHGSLATIVATSPTDAFTFSLKVALCLGLLLATGPVATLVSRRKTQLALWSTAFGMLALLVSTGSAFAYRTYFISVAAYVEKNLAVSPVFQLSALPISRIMLSGAVVSLLLALLFRSSSPSPSTPPPIPR